MSKTMKEKGQNFSQVAFQKVIGKSLVEVISSKSQVSDWNRGCIRKNSLSVPPGK